MQTSRIFISYAWEDDDHRKMVESLAVQLRNDGVNARLDAWDRKKGQSITGFMNAEVEDADIVLVVCSPGLKERVRAMDRGEKVTGGGWEWSALTTELFQSGV